MNHILKRLGGLAALALATPTLAQEQDSGSHLGTDTKFEYGVPKVQDESPTGLFVKSTFATKYRVAGGFTMGEGPVNQSLVAVSKPNILMEGDNAEAYIWSNFDFDTSSFSEVDVGIDYSFPIAEKFLGGKLGGYFELAHWEYPDGALGDNDKGLIGKLNYEGPINATLKGTQMFTSGQGRELDLIISKPISLGETREGTKFTLTPTVSTAYLDNFFGYRGITNVQYGADFSIKEGNKSLEFFVRQQEGFQAGMEDGPVAGFGISIGF